MIKASGGATTTYAYERGRLASETAAAATTSYTYDEAGAPLTITLPSGARYTYRYDRGGSVVQLTDASHQTAASYVYDAWGNVVEKTGSQGLVDANPYTYRGQFGVRWDRETGLFLMGARYYDPALGRFISRDPIAAEPDESSYAYAGNNPVSGLDPTGLYTCYEAGGNECMTKAQYDKYCQKNPSKCSPPTPQPAPKPKPKPPEGWIWPLKGRITDRFGTPRKSGPHKGIDIDCAGGERIRGAKSGRVVFAGGTRSTGYGYHVKIQHDGIFQTLYAHLWSIVAKSGKVSQGQTVGTCGNTGNVDPKPDAKNPNAGTHLHFEVRVNGKPRNPLLYLPRVS